MLAKILILVALLAILLSLGSGLLFMLRDTGRSTRTVKALTLRIGLSVLLFAAVIVGLLTGAITPSGFPPQP